MTDPITCPDCNGEGEHRLGPMRFLCHFCHGTGEVGGENEPAERGEDDGELCTTPAWEQLGADAMPGCTTCFGTGRVIGLGGDVRGGIPATLAEAPCPACSRPT
jgi:hypothetical protein